MTIRTVAVTVDVEVDLAEFSDDEIREEAEERGVIGVDNDDIEALYYAFYFGQIERALEIARKVATDHVGRILP